MGLLLDTQIIVWFGSGDRRLTSRVKAALLDPSADLFVSAVIACEFEGLRARGRLGDVGPIGPLIHNLGAVLLDYPADAYRLISLMPDIHRDPVDRMLIAHGLHADLTIVTADAKILQYPVRCLS